MKLQIHCFSTDIAVLLSGGANSSAVVYLPCEQGRRPLLFCIKTGKDDVDYMDRSAEEDLEMTSAVARRYGPSLEAVDLHREYWDNVTAYAIDKARRGLTPSPDVTCNKFIKFGCFERYVDKDFDLTAAGHHATTILQNRKVWLGTTSDPVKDQADFLAQINYLQVSKLMFPLGGLMKQGVRDIALRAKLSNTCRHDSQGICFLGKVSYNDFVRRFLGEEEGRIIELETGEILGTYRDYRFHTVDQRKGLGLGGDPQFVVRRDTDENVIYVSRGYGMRQRYGHEFSVQDLHFITESPWEGVEGEIPITFKIYHTPDFIGGKLLRGGDGYRIVSEEKLQGIVPGQSGVVYGEASGLYIGSGEIKCNISLSPQYPFSQRIQ